MTAALSIVVLAYRQERWLAETLASCASQRLSPVEWIVAVDRSDDTSLDIAREFVARLGEGATLVPHEQRVGLLQNFRSAFERATGRYIALLEGDDLWLDPEKLALQVELLERRPELVVVGHRTEQVTTAGERLASIPAEEYPEVVARARFLENDCDFHTSSLVFRNVFGGRLPAGVLDPAVGVYDLPLKIALAAKGGVGYVPRTMSRFRRVPGSASSGHTDRMWRDVIRRSFANTRWLLPAELRAVADRKIGSLAARAAIESDRRGGERVALALTALRRAPGIALALWSGSGYGRLQEGVKRTYRRARGRAGVSGTR